MDPARWRRTGKGFDGGPITWTAGALLLRAVDRSIGLSTGWPSASRITVMPVLTEHSIRTLVAQRSMGIALGHEDLNDHDGLRDDPLLALLSSKLEGRPETRYSCHVPSFQGPWKQDRRPRRDDPGEIRAP